MLQGKYIDAYMYKYMCVHCYTLGPRNAAIYWGSGASCLCYLGMPMQEQGSDPICAKLRGFDEYDRICCLAWVTTPTFDTIKRDMMLV
jgi:hypothetical protein